MAEVNERLHYRIAIIGAGYAGLALASLLVQQKKTDDFVIFDALYGPTPVVGDLHVPVAKKLYRTLDWEWKFDSEELIPEEVILRDLRRAPNVLYHHFCYKIEEHRSSMKLSLLVWNRKADESFRFPSAFDMVIICNGVRSNLASQLPRNLIHDDRILLLGDARCSKWWDLGQHRIAQGANQALEDAMEVSQMLLNLVDQGQQSDWRKFNIIAKRREIIRLRVFIAVLMLVGPLISLFH